DIMRSCRRYEWGMCQGRSCLPSVVSKRRLTQKSRSRKAFSADGSVMPKRQFEIMHLAHSECVDANNLFVAWAKPDWLGSRLRRRGAFAELTQRQQRRAKLA